MIRTQVYIPEDLHRELMLIAKQEKVNFSSLIREGVKEVIKKKNKPSKKNLKNWGKGFIGAGSTKGPKDLSSKIDYYLYGGGSECVKRK